MNKNTVEIRDQEVVEKFRAVVASKELQKKKARIRMFGMLLVVACAGVVILFKNFSRTPAPVSVMSKSDTIVLKRPASGSQPIQTKDDVVQPEPVAMEFAAADTAAIASEAALPEKDMQSIKPAVNGETLSPKPVSVLTPRVKTSGKKGLSIAPMKPVLHSDLRIADIAVCRKVKNKRAVSPQNVFSLQKGEKPHVWMDVRSKKTPHKLRHVYYLNGRQYCSVPLEINYPRMRTWSNVTLRNRSEAGQWRVDVVTGKGETLSQVEFTVVP